MPSQILTFDSPGSLLAQNDNLQVHEEKSKGVYVKNLSDYYVSSAREVYEIMRTGGAARAISSTSTMPILVLLDFPTLIFLLFVLQT